MPLQLLSSGSNAHGQLGHSGDEDSNIFIPCNFDGFPEGQLPPRTIGISQVVTGANHTVALLTLRGDGKAYTEIWGCGDGSAGQLGEWYKKEVYLKPKSTRTDVFRKLQFPFHPYHLEGYQCKLAAAGWETTYLVFSPPSMPGSTGDVVISMGRDDWGDLGTGPAKPQPERSKTGFTYTPNHLSVVSFNSILIAGSPLVSRGPVTVVSIAANQHHVVAHLRVEGSPTTGCVVGWGACRHGQISPPGTVLASKRPSIVDTPQLICMEDPDDPFVKCSVGSQHTVLQKASGSLICIGSNRKGQLNVPTWGSVSSVDCTWNGTIAIKRDEQAGDGVLATGSNSHGQLGCGSSDAVDGSGPVFLERLREAALLKVACGTEHVLTLWDTRPSGGRKHLELWAWGWNEHGNLGLGTNQDAHAPVHVATPSEDVQDAWAGSGTSWILCGKPDET